MTSWVDSQRTSDLFISVVTVGEIERGIVRQRARDADFATALAAWLDRVLISMANESSLLICRLPDAGVG